MSLVINDNGAPEICDCACHRCCVPLDEACEDCEDHPWHAEHDDVFAQLP